MGPDGGLIPAPDPDAPWPQRIELLLCYAAASEVLVPSCAPHLQEMLSCHPAPVLNELGRSRLDLPHWTGERTACNGFGGDEPHFPSPQ